MASLQAPDKHNLFTIALECRQLVFRFVSERDEGPELRLRRWFEKMERKERLAAQGSNITPVGHSLDGGERSGQDAVDTDNDIDSTYDWDDEGGSEDTLEEATEGDALNTADGHTTTAMQAARHIPPVSTKWQHVGNFAKFTHNPPPTNLLQVNKQLYHEALDFFYDVCKLRVYVTGAFRHFSFFELVLQKLYEAAFSPLENIRNIELIYVWDSAWLRQSQATIPVWEFMFSERHHLVRDLLDKAPNLKKVRIHWHDSERTAESEALQLARLSDFYGLEGRGIELTTEEHFPEKTAATIDSDSVVGKLRAEFQEILDMGEDHLM